MENPPGNRFCGRCGNRLEAAAPSKVEDVGSAKTMFVDAAAPEPATAAPAPQVVAPSSTTAPSQPVQSAAPSAAPAPVPSGQPTAAPVAPTPAPARAVTPVPRSAAPEPAPAAESPPRAAKLVMLGPDGSPIGERILAPGEILEVGRSGGPPWDEDAYLDQKHGNLAPTEAGVRVEDFDSLNGIFVKLDGRVELRDGDQFRVGQELLLYEDLPEPTPTAEGTERMGSPNPGYWGRVSLLVDPNAASEAYPIEGDGLTVGREDGDITFPQDGYVSSQHCRIIGDDDGVFVEDVGSSNGTYMRVRSGAILPYGSLVLIGQKLFQFERV